MKTPVTISVAFVLGMLFLGCHGSRLEPLREAYAISVFVQNGDVYIAGNQFFGYDFQRPPSPKATLWKNGAIQFQSETTPSNADSVVVSDADVCVAGSQSIDRHYKAALWLNGHVLYSEEMNSYDNISYREYSLFLYGGDKYVAGGIYDGSQRGIAVIWKNGIAHHLTDGTSDAWVRSVFVSGEDVYCVGYEGSQGVFWKNGLKQKLDPNCLPTSVYVFDEIVYLAGITEGNLVALWKNNDKQVLGAEPIDVNYKNSVSVFVSGTDVYVLGNEGHKLGYWKNGKRHALADGSPTAGHSYPTAFANSMFVSDNNVYVVGQNDDVAVLWKNDMMQTLPLN